MFLYGVLNKIASCCSMKASWDNIITLQTNKTEGSIPYIAKEFLVAS